MPADKSATFANGLGARARPRMASPEQGLGDLAEAVITKLREAGLNIVRMK